MIAVGQIRHEDLPELFFKSKPLKRELIAKGEVFVTTMASAKGRFSSTLWFLAPGSSVKTLEYNDSCILYQVLNTDEKEYCIRGKKHKLVNLSESKWLVVIAAKRYVVRT